MISLGFLMIVDVDAFIIGLAWFGLAGSFGKDSHSPIEYMWHFV